MDSSCKILTDNAKNSFKENENCRRWEKGHLEAMSITKLNGNSLVLQEILNPSTGKRAGENTFFELYGTV